MPPPPLPPPDMTPREPTLVYAAAAAPVPSDTSTIDNLALLVPAVVDVSAASYLPRPFHGKHLQ